MADIALPDVKALPTSLLLKLHTDPQAAEELADPTGTIRRCIDIDRAIGRSEARDQARREASCRVDEFSAAVAREIDRRFPIHPRGVTP